MASRCNPTSSLIWYIYRGVYVSLSILKNIKHPLWIWLEPQSLKAYSTMYLPKCDFHFIRSPSFKGKIISYHSDGCLIPKTHNSCSSPSSWCFFSQQSVFSLTAFMTALWGNSGFCEVASTVCFKAVALSVLAAVGRCTYISLEKIRPLRFLWALRN